MNPIQQAISAFEEIIAAGKAAKEALDKDIPVRYPVHPVSGRLTWPISSCLMAVESLRSLQKEVEGALPPLPRDTDECNALWDHVYEYTHMAEGVHQRLEAVCKAYASTAVAAALGLRAVPQGWKLVPVEPTPEMRKAAADAWLDCDSKLFLNKAGAAVRAAIAISKESA